MNFLPADYEAPKPMSNLYFKPQDGENRIRILSKPIFGWEDWTLEKKPIRFKMNEKPAKPVDPKKPIKHFWAMIVWNVLAEQIQIMQVTQATIRSSIEALCKDEEWGSPYEYDIKITKKGEGIETEYSVLPTKPSVVSKEILQAFKDKPIQLEALFLSLDPFATGYTSYTKLMPDAEEEKIQPITGLMGEHVNADSHKKDCITEEQYEELNNLRSICNKETQKGFDEYLVKSFSTVLKNLPASQYEYIKSNLNKKLIEQEMPENKGKK